MCNAAIAIQHSHLFRIHRVLALCVTGDCVLTAAESAHMSSLGSNFSACVLQVRINCYRLFSCNGQIIRQLCPFVVADCADQLQPHLNQSSSSMPRQRCCARPAPPPTQHGWTGTTRSRWTASNTCPYTPSTWAWSAPMQSRSTSLTCIHSSLTIICRACG